MRSRSDECVQEYLVLPVNKMSYNDHMIPTGSNTHRPCPIDITDFGVEYRELCPIRPCNQERNELSSIRTTAPVGNDYFRSPNLISRQDKIAFNMNILDKTERIRSNYSSKDHRNSYYQNNSD